VTAQPHSKKEVLLLTQKPGNQTTYVSEPCFFVTGWVLTLIVAALLCAGLSSLLMYSPQKTAADDIVKITQTLGKDALAMIRQMNASSAAPGNLKVNKTACFRSALLLLI
jgi:hypothetical protein